MAQNWGGQCISSASHKAVWVLIPDLRRRLPGGELGIGQVCPAKACELHVRRASGSERELPALNERWLRRATHNEYLDDKHAE